jgi:hypothetical protein
MTLLLCLSSRTAGSGRVTGASSFGRGGAGHRVRRRARRRASGVEELGADVASSFGHRREDRRAWRRALGVDERGVGCGIELLARMSEASGTASNFGRRRAGHRARHRASGAEDGILVTATAALR